MQQNAYCRIVLVINSAYIKAFKLWNKNRMAKKMQMLLVCQLLKSRFTDTNCKWKFVVFYPLALNKRN
jgi:hypothetical protein